MSANLEVEPEVDRPVHDLLVFDGDAIDYKLTVDKLLEEVVDLKHEREQLYDQLNGIERRLEAHSKRFDANERLWRQYLDTDDTATHDELVERAIARRREIRSTPTVDETVESKVEMCRQVAASLLENATEDGGQGVIESRHVADRVEIIYGVEPHQRTVLTALKDVAEANDHVEHVTGKPGPGAPYNRIRLVQSDEPSHNRRQL